MNRKQKTKLAAILSLLIILALALSLVLYALKQNINLFYTPTQLLEHPLAPDQTVRIGGYVKKHSVKYDLSGKKVNFLITDRVNEIHIQFNGILPSLFREGQGVVVTGKLMNTHLLVANEVLAKHDENYMPLKLPSVNEKHYAP